MRTKDQITLQIRKMPSFICNPHQEIIIELLCDIRELLRKDK